MHLIGIQLAKMHAADVIHGDLTTSNMMLRRRSADAKHGTEGPKEEAELVSAQISSIVPSPFTPVFLTRTNCSPPLDPHRLRTIVLLRPG
jgi:hypothetical protein